MKAPEAYYSSDVAAGLERARGRIFQCARRLRWAALAAEKAAVAGDDADGRRASSAEALKTARAASAACAHAEALIAGAIAVLTAEEEAESRSASSSPKEDER